MKRYNFAAASRGEEFVFGAQRPGYKCVQAVPDSEVNQWIEFMRQQGVARVCCLLEDQLSLYASDLLAAYRREFGENAVCHAPIEDYRLADEALLTDTIFPFLDDAVRREEKVVVHCSAGFGRTGHVLASWLVYARGMANDEAIEAVTEMGRYPHEARDGSGLDALLNASRAAAGRLNYGDS